MGGGDLNLKKSWHPSTLRNIERVWKAEEKNKAEKQKIEQLQKELAEERAREEIQAFAEGQGVVRKKDERLDWMYQGPAALVNREEYLLGRKVDKTLELLDQQDGSKDAPKEKEKEKHPGAIFSQSSVSTTVDLANKIREDPLFTIMKREKEDRKTLLNNPVKMKHLQQLLKQSLSEEKKKKKKKSKKKHKKSRHEESDSSNSSSSDSEDSSRIGKRQKREQALSQTSSENSHSIKKEKEFYEVEEKYSRGTYHNIKESSNHFQEDNHHDRKKSLTPRTSGHDYKSGEYSNRRDYDDSENSFLNKQSRDYKSPESSDSENSSKHKKSYDYKSRESSNRKDHDSGNSKHKRSHDYKSQELSERKDYADSENLSKHKKSHDYKSRESSDRRDYNHSENSLKYKQSTEYNVRESLTRKNHDGYRNGERKEEKRKLSNEDKERRIQEMLDNAKWREEQRQRNVERYVKEDAKESKGGKGAASDFIKPMLSKAASSGSVENRIRQKIFTIQRSRRDMDSNFVRR